MRAAGRTAIVSGGSRGIGRAIAHRLSREGANVVICALDTVRLESVASDIHSSSGGRVLPVVADVRVEAQVQECVRKALDNFGSVDILVNNAGVSRPAYLIDMGLNDWSATLDANLTGAFLFARAVLPHMIEHRRGTIVNIGSRSGQQGYARYAAYCASKFGLMGLTFALAQEVGRHGIRVNIVCPGEVDTDMNRASHPGIADTSDWLQPEAVAEVVAYLVSDEATGIHGVSLNVFGQSRKP